MILHVDANTFYASCEGLFRPDLDGQPIAVLSNNDGIIIALNQKCKDLGFHRGDTYFKIKDQCQQKGVNIFSSNYTLYADISARLNTIYNQFCPEVELYSIDESFLLFPDWTNVNFHTLGHELRNASMSATHIPVSVGGAPTKTLAKLCNKLAKKRGGVCIWNQLNKEQELKKYPVEDIWGIGHSKAKKLYAMGITNAWQLSQMPWDNAKKELTITGFRTVQELNEISVLDMLPSSKRENITSSKSFAKGVTSLQELETAVCEYTQLAAERMHRENSACSVIQVFAGTAVDFTHQHPEKQYFNCAAGCFEEGENYLPSLVTMAVKLLHKIYRQGYSYRKVAVSLLGLTNASSQQPLLFPIGNEVEKQKKSALMDTFSSINTKYGRGCLHLGLRNQIQDSTINTQGQIKKAAWLMNREHLSPEYTTQLSQIPVVKSGT